jgi:hypothetical protein
MFENLNELIEVNLNLLCETKNKSIMRLDFKDEKGKSIRNSDRLATILDEKGLVDLEKVKGFRCDLTEFGHAVFKNGGWLKHLESENLKSEKAESKDVLEFENLKLQNESSEYAKTLRQKEEEIRELTSSNLILQNRQLRRYVLYSSISFILGAILTNLKDISDQWKILTQ